MTKSNKKKVGKKRKGTGGGARGRAGPSKSGLIQTAMGACAVTNPFCPEAVGARWPDDSYTKSVGYSCPGVPIVLSTLTGSSATAIMCVGDMYAYSGATNVSPFTGPPATFTTLTQPLVLPSNVVRYRLTSYGIKLTGVVAPLSASGMVRVRLFSPADGSTLDSIDFRNVNADAAYDVPLARLSAKDLFIVPAPLGILARTFRVPPPNASIGAWENPGWQCAIVAIDGAPAATACLQVTLYYHYEFVFADGDAQNAFATAPPANSPLIAATSAGVMERVGNFFEGAAQTLDKVYQSRAMQYLAAAGASYMTKSPAPLMLMDRGRIVD